MAKDIAQTRDYRDFVTSLKQKVQSTQIKAARAVNTQLIKLYWELGMLINEKQQASGWGDAVIDQIAKDLTSELGGIKGFSRANLYRMKKFYGFYEKEDEKVAQAVRQIPWIFFDKKIVLTEASTSTTVFYSYIEYADSRKISCFLVLTSACLATVLWSPLE